MSMWKRRGWRGAGWVALVLAVTSCGGQPQEPVADEKVTTMGHFEVTAKLDEIRGEFVDRSNYDYAFVMKYTVLETHRGTIDGNTIYVAHYNPQKPRSEAADARVPDVGGSVKRFHPGDVHRMALEVPIDDYYMGGIINRYFEEYSGPVYWALWTNGN